MRFQERTQYSTLPYSNAGEMECCLWSKAFDSLSHDLLLAKLDAYGFDYNSVKLIYDYLDKRHQRVRINPKYSLWSGIVSGVPKGCDLFLFTYDSNIANNADDNLPYACKKDIESVISRMEGN